jgi:hypothetical protein
MSDTYTLERDGWRLLSSEEHNAKLPTTFPIPEHVIAIQAPPDGYVLAKYGPTFFEDPDALDD